jgi:prepilin-type N-terminal cleavage/methylation domain-containing protein
MTAVIRLLAHRRNSRRPGASPLDTSRENQDGFTLIELIVAMSIFAILLGVMMSVVIAMNKDLNKTTSVVDASSQGLRATQAIDKQLRYADFVNLQATGASGDRYVSFEGLTNAGVSECYQWRIHTGGLLQQRSWVSSAANTTAVTATSPSWLTVATGVVNPTSSPPFTMTTVGGGGGAGSAFQQVVVDLVLQGRSSSVGHAETKLTITARNSNYLPGSTQCNAVTP